MYVTPLCMTEESDDSDTDKIITHKLLWRSECKCVCVRVTVFVYTAATHSEILQMSRFLSICDLILTLMPTEIVHCVSNDVCDVP